VTGATRTKGRGGFLCSVNHGNRGQSPKARAARRCRGALSKQLGLIRRDQALALGMSRRQIDARIARGEWVALYPGIYAEGSSNASWRRSALAAVYRGGPAAAVSGPCAATLHSLPGFRRGRIEITTPRQLRDVPFVTRRGAIPGDQLTRIGPIPVTDATRTLLDISAVAPGGMVEDALDDALRRSLTSLPRLEWLLRTYGGKGRKGSAVLRTLVEQRSQDGPIPESVLETRLWKPLTRLGVPHPIRQHEVEWGNNRYRIDFAFPHAMVAVEAQGYRWHSSRASLVRDAEKNNALVALGWRVVYLTWEDVDTRRQATIGHLRDLLVPRFL